MTPARIRAIRDRRNESQKDFAKAVGVSALSISRWENGVTAPLPIYRQIILNLERKARGQKAC